MTGPADRTLAISELAGGERFVLDDRTTGQRLGDLAGDVMPFVVSIEERRYVVFGGLALREQITHVDLASSGLTGFNQRCRVRNDVWMSFPEPFAEGMSVAATFYRGEHVAFECETGPLAADRLEPVFGPHWTSYAPLDQRPG